jgi:hypothetical protein
MPWQAEYETSIGSNPVLRHVVTPLFVSPPASCNAGSSGSHLRFFQRCFTCCLPWGLIETGYGKMEHVCVSPDSAHIGVILVESYLFLAGATASPPMGSTPVRSLAKAHNWKLRGQACDRANDRQMTVRERLDWSTAAMPVQ